MKEPEKIHRALIPEDWGFSVNARGELYIGACSTVALAQSYGTPLHVVDEVGLESNARAFLSAFEKTYPGQVSVHFAFKCNPVPGIIDNLKKVGFKAEVMSRFELQLARELGFQGYEIIINGPYKPTAFLHECLQCRGLTIVLDSMAELEALNDLAVSNKQVVDVLIRINPNYVPRGMNSGTATGSRKGCAFGFDLEGGEAYDVFLKLKNCTGLRFRGLHFHIGSGVRHPSDYHKAILKLRALVSYVYGLGFSIAKIDVGGGIATSWSREMNNLELLLYTGFDRLKKNPIKTRRPSFEHFAIAITDSIRDIFSGRPLPTLVLEPGRAITSQHQLLLLTVQHVKERRGAGKWITTDGGIGTVTMPTLYEFHEVFLCNDVQRRKDQLTTINGPGCFAADQVYRKKYMPAVFPDEIIAIMDSGAYFTSWESSFGFPRPAILMVKDDKVRIMRKRESLDEMMQRDLMIKKSQIAGKATS